MKKILFVVLLLLTVSLLAACGGDGGTGTTDPVAGTTDPAQSTPEPTTPAGTTAPKTPIPG